MKPDNTFDIIFVLDVDLERDSDSKWRFGVTDHSGTPVLAEWRAMAAERVLELGLTEQLVLIGPDEDPARANDVYPAAVTEDERTIVIGSGAGTAGNLVAIHEHTGNIPDNARIGVITNFYHLPRVLLMNLGNAAIEPIAAESFFVDELQDKILADYGCTDSTFSARLLGELRGIRDYLTGDYKVAE
ncbi:hypothetical protein HOI83_01815 [Candidatus Uhrbacteria bacterium]|jgi:hypothetical protein|nr:hypothetical protein [Candidatus Uhrbacteria bacterium]